MGGTGASGGGMMSLMNPSAFSTVGFDASWPSSGLTCCGCGLSGSSILSEDEQRLRDPDEAKELSRESPLPSSFCCPRDSKDGRRERRFSEVAVTRVG